MELTHINEQGRGKMVDVSEKAKTIRTAVARGRVEMAPQTVVLIAQGGMKKGDVLSVAQVAGIMAAKQTASLIPMCHPIAITGVDLEFTLEEAAVCIQATVRCTGETGVEMEALTAVTVAALTIYDMCKAVQKDMRITAVELVEKTGGKSGDYRKEQ
ncbi:cyclic pyranopterin monophosphate synthase MoaC [Bengtsoniella intestinalis]|uniref:cyclic pyranopterin monophosphate synthase MoaC n=1 Tax=Bengtsoniella intestinalis TaxID=3073143 RepID=UPI00391F38BC